MNFARLVPSLWKDPEFKEIVKMGPSHLVLAFYLRTNRFANMLGLYEVSTYHMAKETGLGEDAEKILSELIEADYCRYDPESEFVWVIGMANMQVPKPLTWKQKKGIRNQLVRLITESDCPFVELWQAKYKSLTLDMEQEIRDGIYCTDANEKEGRR
ncbi:MAG: hypothetical protein V7745_02865 [Pseudomonadales bacterium]